MAELRFDDQVAIVTGAGRGLGREHALLLASRGARVIVNDVGSSVTGDGSDHSAAESVAADIRTKGGKAIANVDSVATEEGGAAIVQAAMEAWGHIDVVINNAGFVDDANFDDMTADRFEPLIDVHLKGAFFVTRPRVGGDARPRLRAHRQYDVGGRHPWLSEDEQLRLREDGTDRLHPGTGR